MVMCMYIDMRHNTKITVSLNRNLCDPLLKVGLDAVWERICSSKLSLDDTGWQGGRRTRATQNAAQGGPEA